MAAETGRRPGEQGVENIDARSVGESTPEELWQQAQEARKRGDEEEARRLEVSSDGRLLSTSPPPRVAELYMQGTIDLLNIWAFSGTGGNYGHTDKLSGETRRAFDRVSPPERPTRAAPGSDPHIAHGRRASERQHKLDLLWFAESQRAEIGDEAFERIVRAAGPATEEQLRVIVGPLTALAIEKAAPRGRLTAEEKRHAATRSEAMLRQMERGFTVPVVVEAPNAEREVSPEARRSQYNEWAKRIGRDEAWVEQTFAFHSDGSVTVEGNLNLSPVFVKNPDGKTGKNGLDGAYAYVDSFPPGLREVKGDLRANEITSPDMENFPNVVRGSVDLYNGKMTSLRGLAGKSIYGHLKLGNISDRKIEIPDSIRLGGYISYDLQGYDRGKTLAEAIHRAGYHSIGSTWQDRESGRLRRQLEYYPNRDYMLEEDREREEVLGNESP